MNNMLPEPISMTKAIGLYLVCLIAFIFSIMAGLLAIVPFSLCAVIYVFAGLILQRLVLQDVISSHIIYRSIYNSSSTKINVLIFWPLRYLFILLRVL
ncbi:MAG: hypothetical protein IPP74_10345 [Alphaproteobacteria bacterium]|nr:hypothetical protein [Alphaproteobacteria bacterium]